MRPRFGPAYAMRTHERNGRAKLLDASGGGVVVGSFSFTPTRNAIGLSLPVELAERFPRGSLSPWHSVLPPLTHRRPAFDAGGGTIGWPRWSKA